MRAPTDPDVELCLRLLRAGSKSFYAASKLLPPRVLGPAAAVYGFCRISDDAADESAHPAVSLDRIAARLDKVYANRPEPHPVDRALAEVVRTHRLPRAPFDALFQGFYWDYEQRRYESLEELRQYCVRVAATVGVLMTALMGQRSRAVLQQACALGVAMQLTNIARDVGEDASRGRLYLPMRWLREVGIEPTSWLAAPRFDPRLGLVVWRVLAEADELYRTAEAGIPRLPPDCQRAIYAARLVYADIGRTIEKRSYDTLSARSTTTRRRKAWLLALAAAKAPRARALRRNPVPEASALVEAVAED